MAATTAQSTDALAKNARYEALEQERKAKQLADRNRFEALFAEWLENRAVFLRYNGDGSLNEQRHGDREDELARLITTTPSVLPWMIFYKLEVLEHYLGHDGTGWADNREVVMLAGIKADLLRFEPQGDAE